MRKLTEEELEICEDTARKAYRQHQSSVRGQQLTAADSPSWHVYQAIMDKMLEVNQEDPSPEELAKLNWQLIECPFCGSEGARAFPDQEGYKLGFKDGQREFAEISGGEWQRAVIEQLVIHHTYTAAHDTDPAKAVHDLLCASNGLTLEATIESTLPGGDSL
jgi:hypothetical protein